MTESASELPWVEKYRPKSLDDVIDHQEKITVLRRMIQNRQLPHLLFYGLPGSGKTSLILAAAREMFGEHYRNYILELNASDNRGIDIVRTVIPDFVKSKSDKLRLVILDEVDAMTQDAQSALRRVMENYVKTSRFCLICNNITRIIPGIKSRCAMMRFGSLQISAIRTKVDQIVLTEGVKISGGAIDVLLELNRDFRQVLNSLQCLHAIFANRVIEASDIYDYMGQPQAEEVEAIYRLLIGGSEFDKVYAELLDIWRDNRWNFIDLIDFLTKRIVRESSVLDMKKKADVLQGLSEIEYRVVNGRDGQLQLASLISLFY